MGGRLSIRITTVICISALLLFTSRGISGSASHPTEKGDAFPTPGRRQCTHKYIMIWDVFWEFPAFWGSHGPREDIPPLTSDQSEKLIVFRKRILSRIQGLAISQHSYENIFPEFKPDLNKFEFCNGKYEEHFKTEIHIKIDNSPDWIKLKCFDSITHEVLIKLRFFDLYDTCMPFCSVKRGFAFNCEWATDFCGAYVSLHDGILFKGSTFAKECGTEEPAA
ncbi:general transcription factor 3C polypeptide 2 [Trichonephila clavipes]|nr:general transcription factor 3C polypeptide 2 [Trichonephila clavipes]